MKPLNKALAVCCCWMAFANAASAVQWVARDERLAGAIRPMLVSNDFLPFFEPGKYRSDFGSGYFDLTAPGIDFVPNSSMKIESAWVTLTFFDIIGFGFEDFEFTFSSEGKANLRSSGTEVSIKRQYSGQSGDVLYGGIEWTSSSLDALLLCSLNSSGKLSYAVAVTQGIVILDSATLTANGSDGSVPDGASSLVLTGLGLISLFAVRKWNR